MVPTWIEHTLTRTLLNALEDLVPSEILLSAAVPLKKLDLIERQCLRDEVQAIRQKWDTPALAEDEDPTVQDLLMVCRGFVKP